MTKGPDILAEHEDCWKTTMGLVFPAERVVYRGRDLFHELKDMRWMELLLYGITGRRFGEEQIRLFEGIWVLCTSYPDPKIWNNRVAALAGTARSTATLGISAAISLSEATIYGRRPDIWAIDFLARAHQHLRNGTELSDIIQGEMKRHRGIPGYSRPLVNADERISPLMNLASELGLDNGVHVNLAFQVEEMLIAKRYRMKMNVAALAAALAADQGLKSTEYYQYLVPCFTGGMLPCFIDTANRTEGTFLPLSCSRISYNGPEPRRWG